MFFLFVGIYLTVSMAVASISVILTVFVLKLHHCSPNQSEVPRWVKFLILRILGPIVRCKCIPEIRSRGRKKVGCSHKRKHVNEQSEICMKLMNDTLTQSNHRLGQERLGTTDFLSNMQSDYTVNGNERNEYRRVLNLSSEDNTRDILYHERRLSGMEDVLKYLKVMVAKSDAEDEETYIVDEWKQVALVVDRFLFWSFLGITIISTVILLVVVPGFRRYNSDGL